MKISGARRWIRVYFVALFACLPMHHATAGVPTKRPTDEKRGENLYRENCWQCHGEHANGDGPTASLLATAPGPLVERFTKADFEDTIKVILRGKGDMPAFSRVMDRHDARRILIWLAAGAEPAKGKPEPVKAGAKLKAPIPSDKDAGPDDGADAGPDE